MQFAFATRPTAYPDFRSHAPKLQFFGKSAYCFVCFNVGGVHACHVGAGSACVEAKTAIFMLANKTLLPVQSKHGTTKEPQQPVSSSKHTCMCICTYWLSCCYCLWKTSCMHLKILNPRNYNIWGSLVVFLAWLFKCESRQTNSLQTHNNPELCVLPTARLARSSAGPGVTGSWRPSGLQMFLSLAHTVDGGNLPAP